MLFDANKQDFREHEAALRQQEEDIRRNNRFDRQNRRFGNSTSWIGRNEENRQYAYYFSFVLQIISIIAGYKGGLVLMEWVPLPYLPEILAVLFLITIEFLKRKYSDQFWDFFYANKGKINIGALLKNFALFAASLLLCAYGVYFLVQDNSKEAQLMNHDNDPEAIAMDSKIREKEKAIAAANANFVDWKNNKQNQVSSGEIKWDLRGIQKEKEANIQKMEASKLDLIAIYEGKFGAYAKINEKIIDKWETRINFQSYTSIWIVIICEIIFEALMAFCSKFDFRQYEVEKRMATNVPSAKKQKAPMNGHHTMIGAN